MRKLILLTVLLLAAHAPNVFSQEDDRTQFKMPCPQVLKLGLNKFIDVYGKQTEDYSTLGQKLAFEYYVNCKHPINEAQAKRLGETRRKQVEDVHQALAQLGNNAWIMRYVSEGGGTMWSLASVGAYAEREDFLATLIAALAPPDRKQPAARRRANQSVARAQKLLARWSRTPDLEVWGDAASEQKKIYTEALKGAQQASARLQTLIRDLPDLAAERAARQMLDELTSAFDEVGGAH
jgi:hypothetical protein